LTGGKRMVKKFFTGLAAMAVAFFFTFSFSHAETVTSKMYDAFNKKYSDENYDFKKGSLDFDHVQTFDLSEPIKVKKGDKEYTISKVTAATASFKTVRDYIFYKDWNEYAYYAPDENLILTEGDVMNIKQVQDFQNQYTSKVSLELGPIVLMMLLILVVPFIFGFIWLKYKYNTLEFKLKNNLMEPGNKPR
jgi:hypothetical protein